MDSEIIIPQGFPFAGNKLEEIISPDSVQKRVAEIASEISVMYQGKVPIIIGVLNGAFLFMADLVRHLDIQFEVDFLKIDSYGDGTKSTGTVRLLKDISADITGRHVVVVEDIVDTGLSLKFLKHRMEEASPKSLRFATFLYKPDVASKDISIDWAGFNIEDQFVVGYGLDLKQIYRGLPGIYAVKEEDK
ncbi:MAG: hypoxanthine phosphoribosyltransferase [Candidatus Marinimicrobia bacterium]|nr:hypoxanthine phosphoribosyltransferase [Candidatus Neomarinimicrobiota bacterium]